VIFYQRSSPKNGSPRAFREPAQVFQTSARAFLFLALPEGVAHSGIYV
jgi:hypothetical protein